VGLAYLDRMDEARAALRQLQAEKEGFTCEFARRKLFYLKDPRHLDAYLAGLAKAGVPAS